MVGPQEPAGRRFTVTRHPSYGYTGVRSRAGRLAVEHPRQAGATGARRPQLRLRPAMPSGPRPRPNSAGLQPRSVRILAAPCAAATRTTARRSMTRPRHRSPSRLLLRSSARQAEDDKVSADPRTIARRLRRAAPRACRPVPAPALTHPPMTEDRGRQHQRIGRPPETAQQQLPEPSRQRHQQHDSPGKRRAGRVRARPAGRTAAGAAASDAEPGRPPVGDQAHPEEDDHEGAHQRGGSLHVADSGQAQDEADAVVAQLAEALLAVPSAR